MLEGRFAQMSKENIMTYFCADEIDRTSLTYEIAKIIGSGNDARDIIKYIERHTEILSENEYFKTRYDKDFIPNGFYDTLSPGLRYSINVKYTSIIIAAILLDINISKGFASMILSVTGNSIATIKRLNNEQRCILFDIVSKKAILEEDINYFKRECVFHEEECKYRDNTICCRSMDQLIEEIKVLLENKIVLRKEGKIKVSF